MMCLVQGQKKFQLHSKLSQRKLSVETTDEQKSIEKQCKQSHQISKIKYKTEMCKNYSENGFCRYGKKCRFAHGFRELKKNQVTKSSHYRTKKCQSFWSTGECSYGLRCQFSHSQTIINRQFLWVCGKVLCQEQGDGVCSRLFTLLG